MCELLEEKAQGKDRAEEMKAEKNRRKKQRRRRRRRASEIGD